MTDILLEISKNPRARALVHALGLPIPLPQSLRRDRGPWQARPLADARVAVGAADGAELVSVLADSLAAAGADTFIALPESLAAAFRAPGETFGRPARPLDSLAEGTPLNALVFDASGLGDVKGLRRLYEFFQPLVSRLSRSGRVVVLARTPDGATPEASAAQSALDGFVRSVAKEIGRLGATANLVHVARGAESRLNPVLRFGRSKRRSRS
jgi:3-oxoacyl-[acyl-carrier protein] reductase